jgi:NodT family efflux transporter outer membrane factor (OMF) lipoprotein
MPATNRAVFLAMLAMGCGGCRVGPHYHRPEPEVPPGFGELGQARGLAVSSSENPAQLGQWWTVFHDPTLDSLIERALRNNRDLKIAVSRVREARAERQVAAGALIPELDATAGFNRSLGSKNVSLPLSALGGGSSSASGSSSSQTTRNAAAGAARTSAQAVGPEARATALAASTQPVESAPAGGPSSPFGEGGLPGVTTNLYQAGFDAVWEIDVFGGTRRAIEAADAEAAAAQEGEYGVRVTLLAEVAGTYLQLRAGQVREALARKTVTSRRLTWKIAEDKFKAGLGDEREVAEQAAELRLAEAALPPLIAAERMAQHALAFLLGEEPTALSAELSPPKSLPALPAEIPAGVPSDLLRRRPDVRQAERNLAAATAEVGVATAQLFPQFSLTGSAGLDSSDLKHLPEWSSRYYSIAPGISWPILDWARLHAMVRIQNEEQQQAFISYQNTVAQALKEVEDALVQYRYEHDRNASLVQAAMDARRARLVASQIYANGLADQLATLEAERSVFQAEDALAQSSAALRLDLVSLYKALGGGWEIKP